MTEEDAKTMNEWHRFGDNTKDRLSLMVAQLVAANYSIGPAILKALEICREVEMWEWRCTDDGTYEFRHALQKGTDHHVD